MIDHDITIGGTNVDKHVISVKTEQTIEDDANPGKAIIILANVDGMYSDMFTPQIDPVIIHLKNWIYAEEVDWLVFTGKVIDVVSDFDTMETTITAEDDLGHLVDGLPRKYTIDGMQCSAFVTMVMGEHDPPIEVNWKATSDPTITENFEESMRFQDILQYIQENTGVLYYFNKDGILCFYNANLMVDLDDVTPWVMNPCIAKSVMGFVNETRLTGNKTEGFDDMGRATPAHEAINSSAVTSIDKYNAYNIKQITKPTSFMYGINSQDDLDEACDALQEFYDIKADALTEVKLAGYVPDLQSLIVYKEFVPIDSKASAQTIFGIVLERRITYDADNGFEVSVKLHPRTNMNELMADIRESMEIKGFFQA